MKRRHLSDTYEDIRRLSNAYEPNHRLSYAYDQNLKKKSNFLIFGRFKRKNPRAVGSNRRILDRNVVVFSSQEVLQSQPFFMLVVGLDSK